LLGRLCEGFPTGVVWVTGPFVLPTPGGKCVRGADIEWGGENRGRNGFRESEMTVGLTPFRAPDFIVVVASRWAYTRVTHDP